jgi:beta-fructofuranosidase
MDETSLLKQLARSLMTGQLTAAADPLRPVWHLAPPVGLLNDPNGFVQHRGRYHLFYQWNPFACAHGAKFWGHWSSLDLLNWRHEPVALVPSEAYESHGCYSGSAVVQGDRIVLVYTGNVKYPDGSRTANQCLAIENERQEFDKLGTVLPLPAGYSGHVRDPKVWRHDDHWYMVLGAQDLQQRGKVLLLASADLRHWHACGEIAGSGLNGLGDFGYMWECPDLFQLDEQDILICCPQGLPAEAERYLNTHQAGYLVGQLDYARGHYPHGEFRELDLGFEFYAPQTTQAEDGRRLLFAWMGIPDQDELFQPTIQQGWLHTMTCPRELSYRNDQLWQQPARELQQLRGVRRHWQGLANDAPLYPAASAELKVQCDGPFRMTLTDALILDWDGERLRLSRPNVRTGILEHRYWHGDLSQLQLLSDHSSLEIFINEGEAVMSARYFPQGGVSFDFTGPSQLTLEHWPLALPVVE